MDKSTILKAFNTQFEEFLEDISVLFPGNNDLRTSKTGLLMLRKANPKKIVDVWYRYICIKYEEEIEKENLEFGCANKVLDAIDKIRQPFRELESDNKEKCVQYLKNLNALSKIYNN